MRGMERLCRPTHVPHFLCEQATYIGKFIFVGWNFARDLSENFQTVLAQNYLKSFNFCSALDPKVTSLTRDTFRLPSFQTEWTISLHLLSMISRISAAMMRTPLSKRLFSSTSLALGRSAVVLGSGGALGKAVVTALEDNKVDNVVKIDVTGSGSPDTVVVKGDGSESDVDIALAGLESANIGKKDELLVFNAAGGFGMCSEDGADFPPLVAKMTAMNLSSAALSLQIIRSLGDKDRDRDNFRDKDFKRTQKPLLVLTGAAAAFDNIKNVPYSMLPYTLSKKNVHDLVKSNTKNGDFDACAVSPTIIDTAVNRDGMPDFDWEGEGVLCSEIAETIVGDWWLGGEAPGRGKVRPRNGELVKVERVEGKHRWSLEA